MNVRQRLEEAVYRHLPAGSFRRQAAILAGGTAIGQGLVLVSTPLLTRLYSPAVIGQYGIFLSFLSVAGAAATLCYDRAIPGAHSAPEADALLVLSMAASVPVSLIGALALLGLIHTGLLSFGSLPLWAALCVVPALLCYGTFSALRYWFVRSRRFDEVSRALVHQGVGRSLVPLAIGLVSSNWSGLLAGELVGRSLGLGHMLRSALPSVRVQAKPTERSRLRATARRYWRFPAVALPSSLVDVLALSLPIPLIGRLYGGTAAGLFLVVQRVISLPASMISASIADVFHAKIAADATQGAAQIRRSLFSSAARLGLYGIAVLGPVALLAPFVVGPILGPRWPDAGLLMSALAPWALAALVVSPLMRLFAVVHRNGWKLWCDVLNLVTIATTIHLTKAAGLSFVASMTVTSLTQVLTHGVYFLVMLRAAGSPGSVAPDAPEG